MSDDEMLVPEDAVRDELSGLVEDILSDPESRGLTMCAVGPELGAVGQTVSDGQYETHVALCAVLLKEHVEGLEVDTEEFIKDVVNEFNQRDVSDEWQN